MLKKTQFISLLVLCFAQVNFIGAQDIFDPQVAQAPKELAEIKTKQVRKLTGFKVKEKNSALEKKEKQIFFRVQKWFTKILHSDRALPELCAATFIVGILTSLTPCLYPTIPVTAGILASGANHGMLHQIGKSFVYVLGVASVHSSLGYISATSGMVFGKWLANPYVMLLMILFFIFMALSMFGFYDIQFLSGSSYDPQGRSLIATFVYGLVVGLASSPCLSPILMILLGFVGSMAKPIYGLALLFSFSMGVNMVLMLIGLFAGAAIAIPKPGGWMVEIKKILGFFMLFSCIYFAAPFLRPEEILALISLIFSMGFVYYTYSAFNERIINLISFHNTTDSEDTGALGSFSLLVVIKTILSIVCLVCAVYTGYTAFLTWRKITSVKLFAKLFL